VELTVLRGCSTQVKHVFVDIASATAHQAGRVFALGWALNLSTRSLSFFASAPKLKLDIAGQSENGSDNGIRRDRDEVRHKI
jgi:hypothetical protein